MIKSAFGSKRKARKIQVDDDEEVDKKGNQGVENTARKSSHITAINLADHTNSADKMI